MSPRLRRSLALTLALAMLAMSRPAWAASPPARLIDVVEVTWAGAPARSATADDLLTTLRTDTVPRWRGLSDGSIEFTIDRALPRITTASAMPCDSSGSSQFMNDVALKAFSAAGFTSWEDRYLLMLVPRVASCVWEGRGVVNPPGSTSGLILLNGTADPFVVAHELGHNLGLGHSNLETCTGGRHDGAWADCSAIEYGSATDLMGNLGRTGPLAAYHQWRLGLIPDGDVALGDHSMTVDLAPVDSTTGTRALFIRDRSAAYWVEYRRADPANDIREGLVVYRADPPPASSIVHPQGSDVADPLGTALTTDVWMVSLGDYRYTYPPLGSPSLVSGVSFTTAYGGATLSARTRPDGTAAVTLDRGTAAPPAAPVWTDRSSWTGPTSALIRSDLDDGGMAIARFDVSITTDTTTSIVAVAPTTVTGHRTYLTPLGQARTLRADSLPEGQYSAQVRAVNVAGVAGPWSTTQRISIDLGAPTVAAVADVAAVQPGRSISVRWTGARDAGAGICAARAYDVDGFARLQWVSTTPGTPVLSLPAGTEVSSPAAVTDCFGNVTRGDLVTTSAWTPASRMARIGAWSSAAAPQCLHGTCTARVRTGVGASALVIGGGSGRVYVDGRLAAKFSGKASAPQHIVVRLQGSHRLEVRSSDARLFGVASVSLQWTPSSAPVPADPDPDASLSDDAQARLAMLGFSQGDFAPGYRVLPIDGGTTTSQPTLDLCNGEFASEAERQFRRQVFVTGSTAAGYDFLSSETVQYWSPQAAERALTELDAAEAQCRGRGYAVTASGAHETYAFQALPALPDGLRPQATRRIYLVTIGSGDAARTALIAYQFRGNLLDALYVVRSGAASIDATTVQRWLGAATVFAARLDAVRL